MLCDIEVWVNEANVDPERAKYIAGRMAQLAADLIHDEDPNADKHYESIGTNVAGH